jgi:integrase
MARPPLPVGTWGSISTRTVAPGNVRARARFRDFDGSIRYLVRHGTSKTKAEAALKSALASRSESVGTDLSGRDRVRSAAQLWLTQIEASGLSPSTKDLYRYVIDHYVQKGLGELQLQEVTVARIERFLTSVASANGPGIAKSCKSVLSGLLGMAVRHGALPANPVRDTSRITRPRKTVRALTVAETDELLAKATADEASKHLDLVDLIEFMLGTGVRLGEACAIRPEVIDLAAGVVEINATVIRTRGHGLTIQERPKSAAGWRVIALPSALVGLLDRRQRDPLRPGPVTFPSPLGRLRDVSNTSADLRRLFDRTGFDWVTSHTFRKTVATRLDDAGLSPRQIADQLGHARPSITQDVYMGRKVVSAEAARILDRHESGQ